jgi:regulator of sigma E protease
MPKDAVERLSESGFMGYRMPVFVKSLNPGDPAEKAGIEVDDRIISVGDSLTPAYTELSVALANYGGKTTNIDLLRGNDTINVTATPTADGKLGFGLKMPVEVFVCDTTQYGLFQSIPVGVHNGTDMLVTYVGSLKHLFSKQGAESLGGFGAIGSLFPAQWNWRTFWEMTAFLSIILAFMNILPIPALDGGHIAFLLWEVVTRRKPSDAFLERAQIVGMTLLIALLLYANFNDIYRFLIK